MKTSGPNPESQCFTKAKFPLTSMGVVPDYKMKHLAPNAIFEGGFVYRTQLDLMKRVSKTQLYFRI